MLAVIFIMMGLILAVIFLSETITQNKISKVSVKRKIYPNKIAIGEQCKIELTVKNENMTSVPYLVIEEEIPKAVEFVGNVVKRESANKTIHRSNFFLNKYQVRRRTYRLMGVKRGAYIIKNLNVTMGSFLGISRISEYASDFEELVVYPNIRNLGEFKFDTTSFQGDNTVKRWIHRDPTYIRGIREYTVNDRMKDINWNASLKADKLMVKDYDFTADEEMVIIVDIELDGSYQGNQITNEVIETEIDIASSLAWTASSQGVSVGIWSNSQLVSIEEDIKNEIEPGTGNFNKILEYCARMTNQPKIEFTSYIDNNINKFNGLYTYVFIAYSFNRESVEVIQKLVSRGVRAKIIDVSKDGLIPDIIGVEKIVYRGNEL